MKNLFLFTAALLSITVTAQELSTNIQETYHAATGFADEFHIFKVTNIEPTSESWDELGWEYGDMNFERVARYGENALHIWEEAGVYVVFCSKDQEPIGERTFFIINENYVNYVKEHIDGLQVEDTYIRSDVEWVAHQYDKVIIAR